MFGQSLRQTDWSSFHKLLLYPRGSLAGSSVQHSLGTPALLPKLQCSRSRLQTASPKDHTLRDHFCSASQTPSPRLMTQPLSPDATAGWGCACWSLRQCSPWFHLLSLEQGRGYFLPPSQGGSTGVTNELSPQQPTVKSVSPKLFSGHVGGEIVLHQTTWEVVGLTLQGSPNTILGQLSENS